MSEKLQSCYVCGGTVEPTLTTYFQIIRDEAYIINDVPMQECMQCGERYLQADVAYSVEQTIKNGTPSGYRQVPVYRYSLVERPERFPTKVSQNTA